MLRLIRLETTKSATELLAFVILARSRRAVNERRIDIMYGVIYKITDTDNGKIYIGQTTRTVEERFQ